MRGNTIHLFMSPGRVRESMPLWQYDYGQILIIDGIELPAAYEVHFATDENGNSVTQIGNENGVSIPDALLQSGKPIHVWLYVHTGLEDGETEVHGVIPVARRAKPTNSTPTPVQQDAITEAIAALNAAVAEAEELADGIPGMINNALEAAKASGEFDGFSPVVEITSISGGYRVSITDATGTYTADIMNGQPGKPGDDGYSPTVTITNITGGHRITITDKTGDHSADVMDGEDGDDGISPTVAITEITGGHRVTITDASGDHVFDVLDGYGDTSIIAPDYSDLTFPVAEGSPCVKDNVLYFAKEAIQTSEPWTASHWLAAPNVGTELTSLKNALNQSNAATNSDIGKAHSPKTVVDGKVTEWQYVEVGGGGQTDIGLSVVNGEICVTYEEASA